MQNLSARQYFVLGAGAWTTAQNMSVVALFSPLLLSALLPEPCVTLGGCTDYHYSLCWWSSKETSFNRSEFDILLNGTKVFALGKWGKFTSLTLQESMYVLKLCYRNHTVIWTFSVRAGAHDVDFINQTKLEKATHFTQEVLDIFGQDDVFACENNTLYLYQDQNVILTLGYTSRFPSKVESQSSSALLVSWRLSESHLVSTVSLFHSELASLANLQEDNTTDHHYRISGLEDCTQYTICTNTHRFPAVYCLSAYTDPETPRNLQVVHWNSSSMTVAWDCPISHKFSLFVITILFLNETDNVEEERSVRHEGEVFMYTLTDLPPCSRVKVGVQTVCEKAIGVYTSRMLLVDGNSDHSEIVNLHMSNAQPENYTLSWAVKNTSSISQFRVYHEGTLLRSTLLTVYTVEGLQPCRRYTAKVEAMCGANTLMNVKSLQTHTAPRGVKNLQYFPQNSTAHWISGTSLGVVFEYQVSYENGSVLAQGQTTEPEIFIPGLLPNEVYILDVWETCGAVWSPSSGVLHFTTKGALPLATITPAQTSGLEFDFQTPALVMVLPWRLSDELTAATPRLELERLVSDKMEEMLKGFSLDAKVKQMIFEKDGQDLKISFQIEDMYGPLSVSDLLKFFKSQNFSNISVQDDLVYWRGHDEYVSSGRQPCTSYSICINTFHSYVCVCETGYYDISPIFNPNQSCQEAGMFTSCTIHNMIGSVSKPFLWSYFSGEVTAVLNDGRCPIQENNTLYYFNISQLPAQCGTERLVNQTHVEFVNTLTIIPANSTITRRELKMLWKCVYPRYYLQNSQISVDLEWIISHTLVKYSSSHILEVVLTLYSDDTFSYSYTDVANVDPAEYLYFEVKLLPNNAFALDLHLEVSTCWATESPEPEHPKQGVFLQNRCPVDSTFYWLSENGIGHQTRFGVQMFTMPDGLPIYIHCLVNICGPGDNCTTSCPPPLHSNIRREAQFKMDAVVSAGPLVVTWRTEASSSLSTWQEVVILTSVLGGTLTLLLFIVLLLIVTKCHLNAHNTLQ